MKILYLDLGMGAAGDMICAALYELLTDDQKKVFIDKINSLSLKDISVSMRPDQKCGITGTHMEVCLANVPVRESFDIHDEHAHHAGHHDHDGHDHTDHNEHRHHAHTSPADIVSVLDTLDVSDNVRKNAKGVYDIIAEAESLAHNTAADLIHFHEVGQMDAIADVISACILFDMIAADKVIASPVCTGFGKVRCAHGILPVPAPATANILKDIPAYSGDIEGELCTPTGAALIRHFAHSFGRMPVMKVRLVGYGTGTKDLEAANCVRAMLGDDDPDDGRIAELSCNVDDMTPEMIGLATDIFLEAGAKDVYTTPIGMKRSRPGVMITMMCSYEEREKFAALMLKHTTTIGVRENILNRYTLSRSIKTVNTRFGEVRVKVSEGYGVMRCKYEYEDICRITKENKISAEELVGILDREINE